MIGAEVNRRDGRHDEGRIGRPGEAGGWRAEGSKV